MTTTEDREEILSDLRKEGLNLYRLSSELTLLKQILEYREREFHQASGAFLKKQEQAKLTQGETRELREWLSDGKARLREAVSPAYFQRVNVATLKLERIGRDDTSCLFDFPKQLQVTINYTDRPSVTVDLVESVKANPRNIGHPILVEAIRRYCLLISRQAAMRRHQKSAAKDSGDRARLAKENLDRLFRALVVGAETDSNKSDRRPGVSLSLLKFSAYENEYFDAVWSILREPGVKEARRGGTKLERVRLRLSERFPDKDHGPMLNYLQNVFMGDGKAKLPSRGGGEALRNAVVAWNRNLSLNSAKVYLSQARRWAAELVSDLPPDAEAQLEFTDKELNDLTEEMMFTTFGFGKIKPYESLAGLVQVDTPATPSAPSETDSEPGD